MRNRLVRTLETMKTMSAEVTSTPYLTCSKSRKGKFNESHGHFSSVYGFSAGKLSKFAPWQFSIGNLWYTRSFSYSTAQRRKRKPAPRRWLTQLFIFSHSPMLWFGKEAYYMYLTNSRHKIQGRQNRDRWIVLSLGMCQSPHFEPYYWTQNSNSVIK